MPKTYTTVPAVAAGDAILASSYNTYQKDNVNNLIVPPMCRVKRSGDLNPYTSGAAIAWNAEDYDTDGMHDNSTNNARITINTAGVYIVNFSVLVTFSGTMTQADVQIRKESASEWLIYHTLNFSKTTDFAGSASCVAEFAVNDYLQAQISIGGGTSPIVKADARTWFSATWIGRTS